MGISNGTYVTLSSQIASPVAAALVGYGWTGALSVSDGASDNKMLLMSNLLVNDMLEIKAMVETTAAPWTIEVTVRDDAGNHTLSYNGNFGGSVNFIAMFGAANQALSEFRDGIEVFGTMTIHMDKVSSIKFTITAGTPQTTILRGLTARRFQASP